MGEITHLFDRLVSWGDFLFLHVLPIAVGQIYEWIYEWQILVLGIVALVCLRFWSLLIIRNARKAARETVLSEMRTMDGSLKLLRRQVEQFQAEQSARLAVQGNVEPGRAAVGAVPKVAAAVPAFVPPADPDAAVEALRHAIRKALGVIPISDEALSDESSRLYFEAIRSFDGAENWDSAKSGPAIAALQGEVKSLRESYPPASCRTAWQSLVKINALARDYQDQLETPPSSKLGSTVLTPISVVR